MRGSAAPLLALALLVGAGGNAAADSIEGYTDRKSYRPGDLLSVHVSTDVSSYRLRLIRDAWNGNQVQVVLTVNSLAGGLHPIPADGWLGADWPVSHSVEVPDSWPPGNYFAEMCTELTWICNFHPFVVRPTVPGSHGRIAFLMNFATRNAYNGWGGKSSYLSSVAGDPDHAVQVSFQRPFDTGSGRGGAGGVYWMQLWQHSYLEEAGFVMEYITEWDVQSEPGLLTAYDVVILSGHHEYISRGVYDALEHHHRRGGHLAFFSANTLWWQVRYEQGGAMMVAYRDFAMSSDPMLGVRDDLVTTLWELEPLNRPGEALQGIAYQPFSWMFEPEPTIVQDASHWFFAGTGLQEGEVLGNVLCAGETDYLDVASPPVLDLLVEGLRAVPQPGREPGVPSVRCASTYYEDSPAYGFPQGLGGQVFSGGTTQWGWGLKDTEPNNVQVRQVTSNVINHMLAAPPPPVAGHVGDLRVSLNAQGDVELSWGASCKALDTDFAVYEGVLGQFTSHAQRLCSTGASAAASFTPAAGDTYYLVVPRNAWLEGSYGVDGAGQERPASTSNCLVQAFGGCP